MDNLDKIKFKHSTTGWLFKIDGSGETEFKKGTKFIEELAAWESLENVIEEAETSEEKIIRETKEYEQSLENQKNSILFLLDETDKKVNGSYPNTADERTEWGVWREKLREILKSGKIQTIPPKPFS